MRTTPLIGITGLAGSGKSEAAAILERRGFTRISFATPLKRMIAVICDETDKLATPPILCGRTLRYCYQTLGTEWGRMLVGEKLWTNIAMTAADAVGWSVVIDDVRFGNEAEAIIDNGGFVWRISRPGLVRMGHASEAGVPDELIAAEIDNSGSIADLEQQLENTFYGNRLDQGPAARNEPHAEADR